MTDMTIERMVMKRTLDQADLLTLLNRPDPSDLPPRTHRLTYEGDPNRRELVLAVILEGWMNRQRMNDSAHESIPAGPWHLVSA